MKTLETIQAIGKVPALNRIEEIQQRIKEINKNFGFKLPSNDFQTVLAKEMAKPTENIKPIEEYLAENKLPPFDPDKYKTKAAEKVKPVENKYQPVENKYQPVENKYQPVENRISSVRENVTPRAEKFTEPEYFWGIPVEDYGNQSENAYPGSTEEMIISAAHKFGVDSELVKAVATAESNLNQNAVSPVGAIGVMQLMPETAENLGVNPYNERENIEGGAKYLRQMLDKFNGNLKKAIAAYNAGPGAVQKYGGVPPYSETQNYVGRVLDFYIG